MIHLSADAKNRADALHADESQRCFRIFVESKSKNYILCSHTQEERDLWLTNIQDAIVENHKAILRALNDTPIKRLRAKVAVLYAADGFQKFVAFMLFLNFILNVLDAEFADDRELESQQQQQNGGSDGKFTTMARYFEIADLLFTVFLYHRIAAKSLRALAAGVSRRRMVDVWCVCTCLCVCSVAAIKWLKAKCNYIPGVASMVTLITLTQTYMYPLQMLFAFSSGSLVPRLASRQLKLYEASEFFE